MVEEFVDIAPLYSFKPIEQGPTAPIDPLIDIDPDSSCDSLDICPGMLSPTDIFRDSIDGESVMDEDMGELPYVRRANPINEQQSATIDDESDLDDGDDDEIGSSSYFRVISPYPFSHTSEEEIEDRKQLNSVLEWRIKLNHNDKSSSRFGQKCHVDYSSFFELSENINNDQVMADECDDFSLSSHEANSLSEDGFLGSISEDPASFWEEGVGPIMSDRSQSPTQISLGSAEQ
jgi:hypothetical protein